MGPGDLLSDLGEAAVLLAPELESLAGFDHHHFVGLTLPIPNELSPSLKYRLGRCSDLPRFPGIDALGRCLDTSNRRLQHGLSSGVDTSTLGLPSKVTAKQKLDLRGRLTTVRLLPALR